MKNKNKFIFCSLVLLVYFLLFILKPIYQYISFSKMDVNSSMVQWIQDKSDQDDNRRPKRPLIDLPVIRSFIIQFNYPLLV